MVVPTVLQREVAAEPVRTSSINSRSSSSCGDALQELVYIQFAVLGISPSGVPALYRRIPVPSHSIITTSQLKDIVTISQLLYI